MNPLANVKRLIIHHSASSRETTVETIREWHTDPNKKGGPFEGIGYHRIIDGNGTVHATRSLTMQGAHCLGCNHDSWGVLVMGDNTHSDRMWSEVQIEALERFVDAACELVPGLVVCGHRDAVGGKTATECPGLDVRALLGV